MGSFFTEEQQQIKVLVKDFCKREVDLKEIRELCDRATAAKTIDELRACQPVQLLEKLHDVGLRQLAVPSEYGGGDVIYGGFLTRAIAGEELGYQCEPLARTLTKSWAFCAGMATAKIPEEQKAWFFSEFMKDHSMMVAGSGSEPSSNTDDMLPWPGVFSNTFAYQDGNEWVINGNKMFCHAGGVAGLIRVSARTHKKGSPRRPRSAFWVKKDTPGMTMVVNRMIDGDMNGNVQISFENVRVPENQLVGNVHNGFTAGGGTLNRAIYFAGLLGDAQRLYDQVVQYARDRIASGRPIIQHPNVAIALGEAAADLEATRSLLYRGCAEADRQQLAGESVNQFWAHAFIHASKKTALRLADMATEILGGLGGSVEMPLERFIRHAYLLAHADGTINYSAMKCSMTYNDHKLACQVPEKE